MIRLLVTETAPDTEPGATGHLFGGLPTVPATNDFVWPVCRTCGGVQQYLGRLAVPGEPRLILLFQCQNNPGGCEDWDADAGANRAVAVSALDLIEKEAPPEAEGLSTRETRYRAREITVEGDDYDSLRDTWSEENGRSRRDILGQIRGEPQWLQADETPGCALCGNPMRFLAQLEQGPDWQTEMNFGGGGCAYIFDCSCDTGSAKFLWQC